MKARNPRHGSMGVWPRKRAAKETPRVRAWASSKDAKLLGFAGYKVGMTQIQYTDAKKTSITKGMDVTVPVTIIECPPLKVFGARAYKKSYYGTTIVGQTLSKVEKDLAKRLQPGKDAPATFDAATADNTDEVVLICHTQPGLTGIGKKAPELFEVGIGGSIADALAYAKEMIGKDVAVADLFSKGDFVDAHAVTTGRGYQGVIKRFGVALRKHKSEKGQRRVGARSGGWTSQRHMMYRVAQPGQLGYHKRVDYNKQIMFINDDVSKVNAVGGIPRYGVLKNSYVLIKGSVPGPAKRLIRFNKSVRPLVEHEDVPEPHFISVASKQG